MRLGLHVSIAGGLYRALERGRDLTCDAVQIFVSNPRGWKSMPLSEPEVRRFHETRNAPDQRPLAPVVIHMPYLPNLASESDELFAKSWGSLAENYEKATQIGAEYLVVHMGSYGAAGPAEGLRRMADGINRAIGNQDGSTMLLLENTAGMGKKEPYGFRDIGWLIRSVENPNRLGLCLDTCHAFAAGYNVVSPKGLDDVLGEIDGQMGLEKLKLLHLNDSKRELGSRLDRHEKIGLGHIGIRGFRRIVNHPQLRDLPGILETPRDCDEDDRANLAVMRSCIRKKPGKTPMAPRSRRGKIGCMEL